MTHDQKVMGSNLASCKISDVDGVKAMQVAIHAPKSCKKIKVARNVNTEIYFWKQT